MKLIQTYRLNFTIVEWNCHVELPSAVGFEETRFLAGVKIAPDIDHTVKILFHSNGNVKSIFSALEFNLIETGRRNTDIHFPAQIFAP